MPHVAADFSSLGLSPATGGDWGVLLVVGDCC